MRYNKNQKVPGSNPTRRSAEVRNPTTKKNTIISPNFLVWKRCHSTKSQNLHTKKLHEITVLFAVNLPKRLLVTFRLKSLKCWD